MSFTKRFLDAGGQLVLLKQRGMTIPDERLAKSCLERISYYRLSAYWHPFRDQIGSSATPASDTFRAGTNFTEVYQFYVFDKEIRLLVSDVLERIEVALRAQISDHLGMRDPWAHRKTSELHGDFGKPSHRDPKISRHDDWLRDQDRNFDRSREDFAKHFRTKYSGSYPPIWVAKEVWDWGMLSKFFDGMKHQDKDAVASHYGNVSGKEFVTWIRMMNDIRNICAHHSRLWNRGLVSQPKIPPKGSVPDMDHLIGNSRSLARVYSALVVMRFMMRTLHPKSEWHLRLGQLVKKCPTNQEIGFASAGFPPNWQSFGIWS